MFSQEPQKSNVKQNYHKTFYYYFFHGVGEKRTSRLIDRKRAKDS